ncbi:MAG TPA: TetR/AcrR family transcriptional regulator [Myxococcota bacterium]|nr:TetR/AcrR family transcriptional regulator [Myxococcota bacterium]
MRADRKSYRGNRRPALLSAARKAFFSKGYHGATMEQVARRAGFSKRTVYIYFKNKDELFLSVCEQGLVLLQERLRKIDSGAASIEDSIGRILDEYLAFAREHPDYFRIIFQEATAGMIANISADLRNRLEQYERACLGVVVAVAEKALASGMIRGIDPWEVAASFWGVVTGIILLSLGGSQTVFTRHNREELVAKAVWIMYAGMRQTAAERTAP